MQTSMLTPIQINRMPVGLSNAPLFSSSKKQAIVCFMGPSGVGKSTMINGLILQGLPLKSSSVTSRSQRADDGETYAQHNVDNKTFVDAAGQIKFDDFFLVTQTQNKQGQKEFYASPKELIQNIADKNGIPFCCPNSERLFDMAKSGYKMLLVLMKPPGDNLGAQLNNLKERLTKRGDLSPEAIEERTKTAGNELALINTFDKTQSYHPNPDIERMVITNEDGQHEVLLAKLKSKIQNWWQRLN